MRQRSDSDRFLNFLSWVFVAVTALTMIGLFAYRLIWIAEVFRWFGRDIDEFPIGRDYGPVWVSTGDPSIILYIVMFSVVVPFLVWRRRRVASVAPQIEAALKTMLLFSVFMITMQYFVIAVARITGFDRPIGLITYTAIRLWGAPDSAGSVKLLSVDDPHYVTLLLSFCGLALISDPDMMSRIWDYLTSWFRPPRAPG